MRYPMRPSLLSSSLKPALLAFKIFRIRWLTHPPLKSSPGLLHETSPAGLQNLFIRWLINHPLKPALLNFSMKLALSDFKISASGG